MPTRNIYIHLQWLGKVKDAVMGGHPSPTIVYFVDLAESPSTSCSPQIEEGLDASKIALVLYSTCGLSNKGARNGLQKILILVKIRACGWPEYPTCIYPKSPFIPHQGHFS